MKRLLIAALALAAGAAVAIPVARTEDGSAVVKLYRSECPAEILAMVHEDYRDEMRKAVGEIRGQHFTGCWYGQKINGGFPLIWQDGEQGFVPAAALKDEPEV
jgi:hypothetical protein